MDRILGTHSKIRPQDGCMSSSRVKFDQSGPDEWRLCDVQEVTSCGKAGFQESRTRCGLRNLISSLVPPGEWWSPEAWAAVM